MKRVGILTWILGWGVYSNAQSISKIKDNLHTLQKQNQLQDKQIKYLAKYLNSPCTKLVDMVNCCMKWIPR